MSQICVTFKKPNICLTYNTTALGYVKIFIKKKKTLIFVFSENFILVRVLVLKLYTI